MTLEQKKTQLLAIVGAMRQLNLDQEPRWQTAKALADAMERHGMPRAAAESVAVKMKINISRAVAEDDPAFVAEVVDGMAEGISHLYRAIERDFIFVDAEEMIIEIANDMSLEMDI